MRELLARRLDTPLVAWWASALSLALGLFFVFGWAPHPWGWQGIDQYHELARALARGEPFGTTDVPWGYAYFVAACYSVFGERAWVPVTLQVIANASIPAMLYHLVRPMAGRRTAAMAALLIGAFSFNTVYASTQASDALCTVLFLASLLTFAQGHRTGRASWFAASGLLSGLVPQFRPNMILFPALLATAYLIVHRHSWRRAGARMALFAVLVMAALSPWVARNYRLTGSLLPTSTHGGVQLWYGSLQVGPYLESRAYNPRSIFESPAFDYTSLADQPIVVHADLHTCVPRQDAGIRLVYSTDRAATRVRVDPHALPDGSLLFDIPGQPAPTAIYYRFEVDIDSAASADAGVRSLPADGAPPLVYFVAADHLGDLDRHGDLLDVFDIVRLMRHLAWAEPLPPAPNLDLNADGRIGTEDLERAVIRLLGDGATRDTVIVEPLLRAAVESASIVLADGSSLTVPRRSSGRVTDLDVRGRLASALPSARRPFKSPAPQSSAAVDTCQLVGDVVVNDVFYRKEPHQMRRYLALAFDNIGRDPLAFLAASAYRMVRLFIIRGTDDSRTAQQFAGSGAIYFGALVLSVTYLVVFLTGVALAFKRRSPLLFLLLPIVYVPLTICFVLTNMRYTITVQPLMFAFVALTLVTVLGLDRQAGRPASADR